MGRQASREKSWTRGRTILRSWEGSRSWAQTRRLAEMATGQDRAISEGQEKKSGFGGSKGLRPPALSGGNQWRVCASETSEAKGSCGCGAADAADSGGRAA